jgi:hypothetical protein
MAALGDFGGFILPNSFLVWETWMRHAHYFEGMRMNNNSWSCSQWKANHVSSVHGTRWSTKYPSNSGISGITFGPNLECLCGQIWYKQTSFSRIFTRILYIKPSGWIQIRYYIDCYKIQERTFAPYRFV